MKDQLSKSIDFHASGADPSAIAVVGMACRMPKGLESIDNLWQALKTKFSAIDTVPPERWTVDRYYSSNPNVKGKTYMHRGGFLTHDVSQFDASFFGISPRDAENMDPQQRLLLEVVWEAFENSGLSLPDYAGRKVGVYSGGFMMDHMINQMGQPNRSAINQNTAAGMMMTMLSNRISHTFDLRGPSLSIDTACSSSLVAFHYACQDLWHGITEMAVVGGSNVMLRPEYPMGMSKGHFLSRDGECKSFDARADGYGRGEGAGAILLKPLAAALADGDPILATVIGTGSNQDGHTPGISMPSGEAQQALIREVVERYSIDPREVRYVECHGTGTAIGDPTEARAIGSVYGAARKDLSPTVIGSVKSNIGHLEAAAGVAGVIKAVLTLMYRQAFPLANLQNPNPDIPFDELNLRLADDLIALGDTDEDFCVAVNSFGYGGSNAHVVMRTAPVVVSHDADEAPRPRQFPYFLPISARNPKAISILASKYAAMLRDGVDLADLLYSASLKRAHLSHRAVVKGDNCEQLIAALEALSRNEESEDIVQGVEPYQGHRKPVFVFTGMGPQWWAMGQELYRDEPIYRAAVEETDAIFKEISGFSILAEMLKPEEASQITRTQFAQPSNLLIQIGILAVLRASGIEPGAVIGHSVGEIGSAYAAGVLSLRDALIVSYHRSHLQATCAGTGAMLAVGLGKEQVFARIAHCTDRVSIAAVNSPTTVTLAGDENDLNHLAITLTEEGIFNRKLEVEVPYHSPMMDRILEPLAQALEGIHPTAPQIPLYSTVTGARVESISYGADYWLLNTRQSVEFATAIATMIADGYNTFLEVGPHPVLATSLRDCIKLADKDCRTAFTLRRKTPERSSLHRAIASIYTCGCDIDWAIHNGNGQFIQLPNYAWQRERFWMETDRGRQDRIAPIDYPILGIQEAPAAPVWRTDIDHEPLRYLRDHVVIGLAILPAAAYIESLLELGRVQFEDATAMVIRNLKIFAPMIITADRGLDSVTAFEPSTGSATIRGLENGKLGSGQVHITAKLSGLESFEPCQLNLALLFQEFCQPENVAEFYKKLAQIDLTYGPAFQTIRQLFVNQSAGRVLSRIEMQPELTDNLSLYCIHPTVLDACFQSLMAMLADSDTTYLPTGFGEMCVYAHQLPANIWCLAEIVEQNDRYIDCNLNILDDEGNVLATIRGMRSTAAAKKERTDRFGDHVKRQILAYEWAYGETLNEAKRLGYWLVVSADHSVAQDTIRQLENYGAIGVFSVAVGDTFREEDGQIVAVRHGSVEDAQAVLSRYGELDGIAFMHGLAANAKTDPTGERAVSTAIAFTQAAIGQQYEVCPRIYMVTQSAFAVNENETSIQPNQTALNGFTRVAFNELEGFRCSTIDLPARINEDIIDNLALELLCDDLHDEVALRGNLRLVSELLDSTMLTQDRVTYKHLDDNHPVLVRPLRADCESIGMARILATNPTTAATLGADGIQLRVQATIMPSSLRLEPSSDVIQQPVVEVVGEVIAVGDDVTDLAPGTRVCGFAPADLGSHLSGARSQFYLVPIDTRANATALVSTIGAVTRAESAIATLDLMAGDKALVYGDTLGLIVAEALQRKDIAVTLLCDQPDTLDPQIAEKYPIFSICPEAIHRAVTTQTDGAGFTFLVAPMHQWTQSFDLGMLRTGGYAIDTDDVASPVCVTQQTVARTDMTVLLQRPRRLQQTLQAVIDGIVNGTIAPLPALEVSIADIAWQKLGISETKSTLVLTYETGNRDLPVVEQDQMQFKADATYLVTGGFGGFGQKTAEWLVQNGARHLVLTGRTGADTAERKAIVQRLEAMGATVKPVACDTADYGRLSELFAEIDRELPSLKGVFHSGALIIDQPIAEIDPDTCHTVMQSKALGGWNLHRLTQSLELDHFVLYSSIANLVGNGRQAVYSAANGFLNGLAFFRKAQGLPATSVNWGAIADVGVVAQDEKLEEFLRYTGLRGINSAEALDVLKVGLARNVTQFGVTVISSWADWARFETRGATSPRFASLIAADSQGKDNSMRDVLMGELLQLGSDEQVDLLASLILEIIASVLKSDPASIPVEQSIDRFGVDSLMATEIQMLLDSQLGLNISIMELLGDATIRSLAKQSLKSLLSSPSTVATISSGVNAPAGEVAVAA